MSVEVFLSLTSVPCPAVVVTGTKRNNSAAGLNDVGFAVSGLLAVALSGISRELVVVEVAGAY